MARLNENGRWIGRFTNDGESEMAQIAARARVFALAAFISPLIWGYLLGLIGIHIPFMWQVIVGAGLSLLILIACSPESALTIIVFVGIGLIPTLIYYFTCKSCNLKFEPDICKGTLILGGIILFFLIFPELFKGLFKFIILCIKIMIAFFIFVIIFGIWVTFLQPAFVNIGNFFSHYGGLIIGLLIFITVIGIVLYKKFKY